MMQDDVREQAIQWAAFNLAHMLLHAVVSVDPPQAGPNTVLIARAVIDCYEQALNDGRDGG